MSTNLDVIAVEMDNGKVLPMRATTSKHGNAYWAVLNARKDGSRYDSGYGVNVGASILGEQEPSSITVLGESFTLARGLSEKGKQTLKASGTVVVPGVGKKAFSFRITAVDPDQGVFNVAASVHGARANGGSRHILDEL